MERSSNAKFSWPSVVLIVLIVCLLSYLLSLMFSGGGDAFSGYETVPLPSNHGVQVISNGFVYYDGSALGMVSSSGSTRWSYMIGSGCEFSATDTGVAAWNDRTLTLIDIKKGTTTYSGNMDGPVITARMGGKYSAVVYQSGNGDSTVILLDEKGNKLTPYIEMDEQTVVDYGFFSGDTLFWTLALDAKGTTPTTTISTYRPGRSHMGNISNTDQVLYRVLFQSSHIVCVGENYIKTYDYMGAEDVSKRKLVYGWYLLSADTDSADPLMAFAATGQYNGDSTIKDVRLVRSGVDQVVHFPFGCKLLTAKGNKVYGFSTEGYMLVAQVGQKTASAYQLPVNVDSVYGVTEDNVAVLGYGSNVYLVRLP